MSFFGVYLSNQHNDRVDQRRGEVPSFAVSIRGIPKGGRNRNLPPFGVLSLFVHFLFARAKRKWTPTKSIKCRKRDVEDPVPLGGEKKKPVKPEFLADLEEIRKAYARSVCQDDSVSTDHITLFAKKPASTAF
jgi:hypothetical protein